MVRRPRAQLALLLGLVALAIGLEELRYRPAHAQTQAGTFGRIAAAQDFVAIDVAGQGAAGVQLTGTWTGTIQFEGSVDGGTFVSLSLIPSSSATGEAAADVTSATANGAFSANIGGYSLVRARASAWTSGTAVVTMVTAGSGGK